MKVGDVVVFIGDYPEYLVNKECRISRVTKSGVCLELEAGEWVLKEDVVLKEIYDSPLYQALKED